MFLDGEKEISSFRFGCARSREEHSQQACGTRRNTWPQSAFSYQPADDYGWMEGCVSGAMTLKLNERSVALE